MRKLNVWLEASTIPIGELISNDDGGMVFAYTFEWLSDPNAHPLSLSMPLREEPYGDLLVRSWFDNLLHENKQISLKLRQEGIARDDIAAILGLMGADCAGAVSVLPLDHPPIKRPGVLAEDYDLLDERALRELVWRLKEQLPLPESLRDPSPVAGYRDKYPLALIPDVGFAVPKAGAGAPTTHILKIPDPNHRDEARDEAFVTLLAHQCGLPVGVNSQSAVGEQDILLIRRFDRHIKDGRVYRRHQEDFAQALGLPAALKYERNGREGRCFNAKAIGHVLAATARPALARDSFLRVSLFNLLIGNNDNHAKNHGLFHLPGQAAPELTPYYDLVPVQTVEGFRDDFSFNIGKATRPHELTADDLLTFCTALGIPAKRSGDILHRVVTELVTEIEKRAKAFPPEMRALDSLIGEEAERLNKLLGLGLDLRDRDDFHQSGGGRQMS